MKISIKCRIGIHEYKNVGKQSVDFGGWTLSLLTRSVDICFRCGKVKLSNVGKVTKFDISNKPMFEEERWKPSLEVLAKDYFRDLKIRKLIDENKSD